MIKTKEFIEKVEKLGFDMEFYKTPFSNVKSNYDYDLITISANNQVLVKIWANCQYAISTVSDGHSEYLYGYDVQELYKLCFEYTSTPPEDREEEKKYYLRHKWIGDKQNCLIKPKTEWKPFTFQNFDNCYERPVTERGKFTLKEIEELKEKFNTDLSDFEMVEVEE